MAEMNYPHLYIHLGMKYKYTTF